jgi:hypothetical protein
MIDIDQIDQWGIQRQIQRGRFMVRAASNSE